MKPWLLVAVSLFSLIANAADWQDTLTAPQPGSFPPPRPMKTRYKFGWTAFTAADSEFDLSRPRNDLLRLGVKTGTIGFVRTLWKMDAQHTSQIRLATFQPVSVVQSETYSDERRTTRLAFDAEGVTRTRETTPLLPGKKDKPKRFKFRNLYDLHGALQFVRSQKLNPGDVYKLVVYASSAPYLAQVTVLGRERIEAGGRNYDTIKMDLKLWRINDDTLKLEPYTKCKKATAWVSDDADRLLVKVDAEIFVGSVWAELQTVQFAKP